MKKEYNSLTKEEKLRLLYAILLVNNVENVPIEQIEKDLNMVNNIDGTPYEYEGIPDHFEPGDCVIFRFDQNSITAMDVSNTLQSISEYCPDVNMIFIDKNIKLDSRIIDPDDYNTLMNIIRKYYNLEENPDEEDDDDDKYLNEEDYLEDDDEE